MRDLDERRVGKAFLKEVLQQNAYHIYKDPLKKWSLGGVHIVVSQVC